MIDMGWTIFDPNAREFTEQWQAPTLENSWVVYDTSNNTPGYWKSREGVVHLRGLVKDGSAGNATICTLPPGYRPARQCLLPGQANGASCGIAVNSAGVVFAYWGGSTVWTGLDGVHFRAAGWGESA